MKADKRKKLSGPHKAKIANRQFNVWLKKSGYKVLGREFKYRVQSGGWPDFIVRNKKGGIEFFEVKSGNHKVDHHQIEILEILRKLGKVHVMRYDDSLNNPPNEETTKWL